MRVVIKPSENTAPIVIRIIHGVFDLRLLVSIPKLPLFPKLSHLVLSIELELPPLE
jgi:hypothetical protein